MPRAKSQFQDIIPPEKRSIRNIPLSNQVEESNRPDTSVREKSHVLDSTKDSETFDRWRETPYEDNLVFNGGRKVGGLSKLTLWIITLLCATTLFLSIAYFFTSAEIVVETKKFTVPMPSSLDLSLTPEEGQVGYSVVSFNDTLSESVVATGEKDALSKATGTIVVYNAFNSSSQKFVEGTRFETPNGLIYKSTKAITIPGTKTVSGKEVPGSIEVVVIAEKAGPEYNIELSDFTVPGLKNDPRYSKFYARSKTSMTGGESGKIAVVSDEDLNKAVNSLKEKLSTLLKEKLKKELPPNQVLFNDASVLDFKVSNPKLQNDKALIEVTGSIKAYVLDSNTLSRVLLKTTDVEVEETDNFTIDPSGASAVIKDLSTSVPSIDFAGEVTISYVFPKEEFKTEIAGISEDQIPEISKQYPAISKIRATIKPFWKSTFPKNIEKIDIEEL